MKKINATCTIYLLINIINGKVYIGQTWRSLKERFSSEGRGYAACPYLYNAIKKYGWGNFESGKLAVVSSQKEANEAEDYFINFYSSRDPKLGYNIRGGGATGQLSNETKQKLSILNSGEKNHFFGKTHTTETKQKISENTKIYHRAGSYDTKNEDQKRFSDEEEKEIVASYLNGNILVQDLLNKYNFSHSVFEKLQEKYNFETIVQPKSEEHIIKLRENVKLALPFALIKREEDTIILQEKVVALRMNGLLQKDIANILKIEQVRVSQLLIKANLRTKPKLARKKKITIL
jgi:group I intron endonuclease